MPEPEDTDHQQVADSFGKVLNRHGYGFQFSVLERARDLARSGESTCNFVATEFPVQVQGTGTRIDLILKRERRPRPFIEQGLIPLHVVAECKRANPRLSNWCFVRAPYIHDNRFGDERLFVMERFEHREDGTSQAFSRQHLDQTNPPFHIGLEVRSLAEGDPSGESGRAIEDAASQVSRGLNGFVEMLAQNVGVLGKDARTDLLPVIFTTANLWGSDIDLSKAELESGESDLTGSKFEKLPWLWYHYHLSPGLKHSSSPYQKHTDLGELMESEYIRSIAIVSPSGIESFLKHVSWLDIRS